MNKDFRWGIIGSGFIAGEFAKANAVVENSVMEGITSRTRANAEAFAETYDVPNVYDSLKELLEDKAIDGVYVASLNHEHASQVKMALEAGKHVFCEKPFTLNSAQLEPLLKLAKDKNLLLMEAM